MAASSSIRHQLLNRAWRRTDTTLLGMDHPLFKTFTTTFYEHAPQLFLEQEDAIAMAASMFSLVKQRLPGNDAFRVFNPKKDDGWSTPHTAVMVVTDDRPFLVDSLQMTFQKHGLHLHGFVNVAGMLVCRDTDGKLTELGSAASKQPEAITEACAVFLVSRMVHREPMHALETSMEHVLSDVRLAVTDWSAMQDKMREAIERIKALPTDVFTQGNVSESAEFCTWLLNYFTFLGYREYRVGGDGGSKGLMLEKGSSLGVLRNEGKSKKARYYADFTEQTLSAVLSKAILMISKTNTQSTVHRPTYTDCVIIKCFNETGELVGEMRFIGLFTADVYDSDPTRIPVLRQKVDAVLKRSALASRGYGIKQLTHILKKMPRDELLQASVDEVYHVASSVLALQGQRQIRTFLRRDVFNRFIACLIYLPRDNFSSQVRERFEAYLMDVLQGIEVLSETSFSESQVVQISLVVRVDSKQPIDFNAQEIEQRIEAIGRAWRDDILISLRASLDDKRGYALFNTFVDQVPTSYKEAYQGMDVVDDFVMLERLQKHDEVLGLSPIVTEGAGRSRLKIFQRDTMCPLSEAIPCLENMGLTVLEERAFMLRKEGAPTWWITEFRVATDLDTSTLSRQQLRSFHDGLLAVWQGLSEDDGFNKLMLLGGLTWRDVNVLRSYANYMKQLGFPLSPSYIQGALERYPHAARVIMDWFDMRFNPEAKEQAGEEWSAKLDRCRRKCETALAQVTHLDDDRIFHRYLDVIEATVRTNMYRPLSDGSMRHVLAFKVMPQSMTDVPKPVPMYEIFVYGTRFEGVHLRYDKVSRGGLRWSDRYEDYRTEILGLMKAQVVKNAVIVPSGAKGGFVPKCLPKTGEFKAIKEEALTCYKAFIEALLSLTDNRVGGVTVRPSNVVCHDDEDSYLVVAADKGTATFSDTANSIALAHDFWLGDGFASGGSDGYDHKKMGITAKGAWESVRWHSQGLELDLDTTPTTVVGIGDMSGDVFGNGMLLSQELLLLAAFNHEHIFIDPTPDPAVSFAERQRLFNLPRSRWSDYNPDLISRGGGVYERSAKSIKLSRKAAQRFGLSDVVVDPQTLIRHLLTADVDLLWNGGIGTYVKASSERHLDAGDRTNDGVRVDANALRCRMVGEGGNLGLTQAARVEFALRGGLINTDFIDNCAGVDCSDHEVNIKIVMNQLVKEGVITLDERNHIMRTMEDEVATLVLDTNRRQSRALSCSEAMVDTELHAFERFMDEQEAAGYLDRGLEGLPSTATILNRQDDQPALTRPELSVLLTYSKISLKRQFLACDWSGGPDFKRYLHQGFPSQLIERFPEAVTRHPLSKEIVATQLANAFVTELGITFVQELRDEMHVHVQDIVCAYLYARDVLCLDAFEATLEAHQASMCQSMIVDAWLDVRWLLRRTVRWLLRNQSFMAQPEVLLPLYTQHMEVLRDQLPALMQGKTLEIFQMHHQTFHHEAGLPDAVARQLATVLSSFSALNIIQATLEQGANVEVMAGLYFASAELMGVTWLRQRLVNMALEGPWDGVAKVLIKGDIDRLQRSLTTRIHLDMQARLAEPPADVVADWLEAHSDMIQRWKETLQAIDLGQQTTDFATAYVVVQALSRIAAE